MNWFMLHLWCPCVMGKEAATLIHQMKIHSGQQSQKLIGPVHSRTACGGQQMLWWGWSCQR